MVADHYRSLKLKIKLNKAIKDLKKLLNGEKTQACKCIFGTSVPRKHLITL
jgi:hypothetical protein